MRVVSGLLLLAIGAAGAIAADRLLIRPVEPLGGTPPVERTQPGPGDPPIVWIGGSLEEVGEDRLLLRESEDLTVDVERFAGNATRFFRPGGSGWQELPTEDVGSISVGEDACIEAIVDGETFLAIRVYLERTCAPV
jgi:hypothetical protein